MIFGRPPKSPLADAIQMIDDAMEITYMYLRDTRHLSSQEELALMDRLADSLFAYHATAQYISRKMRGRAQGDGKF